MLDALRQRGLPVGLLAVAALAVVAYALRPSLLTEGVPSVVVLLAAVWAAASATFFVLLVPGSRLGRLPAPTTATLAGHVAVAVVLVGLVLLVEPDPALRAVAAGVGPGLGVVLFVAALWFHRPAADAAR